MQSPKSLSILKKRKDFLAVRKATQQRQGRKAHFFSPFFIVEARKHNIDDNIKSARFGFTVSKKNGNAVVRNKIKRRFKEIIRTEIDTTKCNGIDFVIIARKAAYDANFSTLVEQVKKALYKPIKEKACNID